MTSQEHKEVVRHIWLQLEERADRKEINRSSIYNVVQSAAERAASSCGSALNWREYMPKALEERDG